MTKFLGRVFIIEDEGKSLAEGMELANGMVTIFWLSSQALMTMHNMATVKNGLKEMSPTCRVIWMYP